MPFPDELGDVDVVGHRPTWAEDFEVLRARLAPLGLGPIDHIGSTAVPGLVAKDVIDVQVRVQALDETVIDNLLAGLGFRLRPEPWNRLE